MRQLIILLIVTLSLTSCMDVDMQLKVGSRGNGELDMRFEMLEQMYTMMRSPQEKQDGIQLSLFEESALNALAEDHGGRVLRYRNTLEEGVRKVSVYIVFPDAKAMVDATMGGQATLTKSGDAWKWSLMDHEAMTAFGKMDNELLNQQINMLRPSLRGMKVKLEVIAPRVVDSNMKRQGKGVQFDFDFDRDIGERSGVRAVESFKSLLANKWVRYKLK